MILLEAEGSGTKDTAEIRERLEVLIPLKAGRFRNQAADFIRERVESLNPLKSGEVPEPIDMEDNFRCGS